VGFVASCDDARQVWSQSSVEHGVLPRRLEVADGA
jgi:hypothetical protein